MTEQQDLRQKAIELDAIHQALPDLYFRIDREGRILDYHAGKISDLYVPPEEFLGKRMRDVLPGEVADRIHQALEATVQTMQVRTVEYALPMPGGEKDFEARLVPLASQEFMCVVRDITPTRIAQHEMERVQSLYQATLESTADGILVVDPQERITSYNSRFLEIWNIPSDAIRIGGDRVQALAAAAALVKDKEQFHRRVEELYANPNREFCDFIELKDGRVLERYTRPQILGGRVIGRVLSFRDVTEHRRYSETQEFLAEIIATASETKDVRSMTSRSLEQICRLRGWNFGQAWLVDERGEQLFCSHSFFSNTDVAELRSASLSVRYAEGEGLVGAVWQSGAPSWIQDLDETASTPLTAAARACGMKAWFAFPIRIEEKPFAVFEFYSVESRLPDSFFLSMLQRLGAHLGVLFDRRQEEEVIRYQAYHDLLTDLPNRVLFQDRLAQSLAHASRSKEMVAVLFLDLDRFKNINDTLGHDVGDLLLQQVARRLSKCLREGDTIARMGGDEFTIILPRITQIQDAAKVAQKVFSVLEPSFLLAGHEFHVTTSIGISLFPHDASDPQSLMKNADVALYRAKEKGRNNYQLYSPAMTVTALERLKMETDLRKALERREFVLHYQPQIRISTGEMIGVEALIRWNRPDGTLFMPAEFIHIAEDTGLIGPIWQWALQTACEQNTNWQKAGVASIPVTMNISAVQFHHSNLVESVARILKDTGLRPEFLELEITESMAMKAEFTIHVLKDLKEMGVRISMDDFGAGYSSLTYLKRFPIDTIKIDSYFIREITTSTNDLAIAGAIISLGHGLGMTVVAEGVETEDQLETLIGLKCDAVQGFLFSRPLPPMGITDLLSRQPFRKGYARA